MISEKIINQLRNARTLNGMVGMKVKPTGDSKNLAWITIQIPNRNTGLKEEFKLEYVEFKAEWETEEHDGFDWDLYILNERIDLVGSIEELEQKLKLWTTELDKLTPLANLDHPKY